MNRHFILLILCEIYFIILGIMNIFTGHIITGIIVILIWLINLIITIKDYKQTKREYEVEQALWEIEYENIRNKKTNR